MNDVINATKIVAIVSNLARPRSLGAWTPGIEHVRKGYIYKALDKCFIDFSL